MFLAGSVSSIGQPLAPIGTIEPEEALAIFTEQIEALLEAGVDLLVLETFSNLIELRCAIQAARAVSTDLPIVAEVSVRRGRQHARRGVAGRGGARAARSSAWTCSG